MYEKRIPEFAHELDSTPFQWDLVFGEKPQQYWIKKLLRVHSGAKIHAHGINFRHLGFLRLASQNENVRKLLLCISIARIMKNIMHERMRIKMRQVQVPSDHPFKSEVVFILNLLVGNSESSNLFWKSDIKEELILKYKKCLTPEELDPEFDLRVSIWNRYIT